MRRWLAALLGAVLLAGGLTGCGIPDNSDIEVDGPGPSTESGSAGGRPAVPPPWTASRDPAEFVKNYLSAAAGEPDRAYDRAREYIAPESRELLPKRQQSSETTLTVVRLRDSPVVTQNSDTTTTVTVAVQQVGLLRADGTLAPPVASDSQYRFRLRPATTGADADQPALLITELPNVLLLSDTALRRYYATRTIYFWNSDQTRLVPDQRYLFSTGPTERLVTEVVKWLTGGPSDWLTTGVTRLPDNTAPINNATGSDGRWEVNLAMTGANDDRLDRLATQLAWSLGDLAGQLELKIQNQSRRTFDLGRERLLNPVYPLTQGPERFAVYDGAVHPLALAGEPSGTVPVLPERNKGVVSAALSRAGTEILAALVVSRADRRQQLKVGYGPDPVTVFNDSARWYGAIGRPVWLRSADPRHPLGLVVADNRLYRFDGNAVMSEVSLPVSGPVGGVAAALDGHRIALIIGGALYVAAVNLDGGLVSVGQPRRLVTTLTGVTAVDWGGENELVVAGSEGRPAIYQTSVDGVAELALRQDIGAPVTHLAAYPTNPVVPLPNGAFMYEANRVAYRNPFDTIKRDEVLEVTPPAAGARASNPTAPFFLY